MAVSLLRRICGHHDPNGVEHHSPAWNAGFQGSKTGSAGGNAGEDGAGDTARFFSLNIYLPMNPQGVAMNQSLVPRHGSRQALGYDVAPLWGAQKHPKGPSE